ncbi:SHOCT domain-containing protein [Deinococcus sp. A31D244]|uniref:SHOCT domain-containing protein n=1 Tax=Deinococcus sp. A31D244 TaxID=3397675 RepID=UPI0039E087B1
MMWNPYQMGWLWPVLTVLFLFLLGVGVVLFARWFSNNADRDSRVRHQGAALDTAGERFARGEITAEEFESMKRSLGS